MKYKINKTLVKVLYVAGEITVAGGLAYVLNRPELIFLAPIFEGILDWIKHR